MGDGRWIGGKIVRRIPSTSTPNTTTTTRTPYRAALAWQKQHLVFKDKKWHKLQQIWSRPGSNIYVYSFTLKPNNKKFIDEKITLRYIRTGGPEFNCFEVEGFVNWNSEKPPRAMISYSLEGVSYSSDGLGGHFSYGPICICLFFGIGPTYLDPMPSFLCFYIKSFCNGIQSSVVEHPHNRMFFLSNHLGPSFSGREIEYVVSICHFDYPRVRLFRYMGY